LSDFTPREQREFDEAMHSLDKNMDALKNLFLQLPENNDLRITSILIGASFELFLDIALEFRFKTNKFSTLLMFDKKRQLAESEKIISVFYSNDMALINNIRNLCAHNLEINIEKVKTALYGTRTFERNKELLKKEPLEKQFRSVSLLAFNTIRQQYKDYITKYLNDFNS